jgi:hypothetical protein
MAGGDLPDEHPTSNESREIPWWLVFAFILGLYLTARGYHSFDGDQAYRLPLLLRRQNPQLYADDPFVRAFDTFNPHRGSLMVLDLATRPLGLAVGLFLLFVLSLAATWRGVDAIARAVWPQAGRAAGLVAVGLVLAAKAGNIGTNHLFEAMVLDRLTALALGWLALAQAVARPRATPWWAMAAVGAATWIHPSVGLQLALVLAASWIVWLRLGRSTGVSVAAAAFGCLVMAVAVVPGLAVNLGPGTTLFGSMPADLFWLLSVELQSPQHMLPHLWRLPQWLGCASYLALALLAILDRDLILTRGTKEHCLSEPAAWRSPPSRVRLTAILAVTLVGLAGAWVAIEKLHLVRVTVFQPFRMATVARGIALILIAGRVVALWRTTTTMGRLRAILICVSVTGDWLMVVTTLAEVAVSFTAAVRVRLAGAARWQAIDVVVTFGMLALGLNFLGHHDTEYGHIPLLIAVGAGLSTGVAQYLYWRRQASRRKPWRWAWAPSRRHALLAGAWAVPVASFLAGEIPDDHPVARMALVRGLINRCRLMPVPVDDIERLALWCRDHTPENARFIGPPGPKTFRLWAQRSLAFNRSASPYHADALADWFSRFQDHVDHHGPPSEFVRAYVADRHGFEARYDRLGPVKQAALALRQGADYVIAPAPSAGRSRAVAASSVDPLELVHVEGRFAVYHVKSPQLVHLQQ